MKNLWVFDLDDTLIDNVHDYTEPFLDAIRLIVRELGSKAPHVSKIVQMEEEIDNRRLKEINPASGEPFGYSMERWPGTLVETYRAICAETHAVSNANIERQLYDIGLNAFNESRYRTNVKPGVVETLRFLEERGDILAVCTKGDPRVQNAKLRALYWAWGSKFSAESIVKDKPPEVFSRLRDLSGESVLSPNRIAVGNDYRKDVKPALEVGYRGIYIPVETWETIGKMDAIRAEIDRSRCHEFENITEIMARYDEVASWAK